MGFVFFFKHKTAYGMLISDWNSDVCSSDLGAALSPLPVAARQHVVAAARAARRPARPGDHRHGNLDARLYRPVDAARHRREKLDPARRFRDRGNGPWRRQDGGAARRRAQRSEEHTSELQSLMRISYAVFCLKKK